MPREPKPYRCRGYWVSRAGGKRRRLCRDTKPISEAKRILRAFLAGMENGHIPDAEPEPLTVGQLTDAFLDFIEANRSSQTYSDYHFSLKSFVAEFGSVSVEQLTFLDGERHKQGLLRRGKSKTTVNHFVRSLRILWNWGMDSGLIKTNPFRRVECLPDGLRERLVSDAEFRSLLRNCWSAEFRQVLLTMRFTPCRPSELRKLKWSEVDWTRHCWILREHKTRSRMKHPKPKIVPMLPVIERLLRVLQRRHGRQPFVFLNSRNEPWTGNGLVQAMDGTRLRAKIGKDDRGEPLTLYHLRHTLLTDAARSGVTGPRLKALGGWTTLRMADRYVHLAEQDAYEALLQTFPAKSG